MNSAENLFDLGYIKMRDLMTPLTVLPQQPLLEESRRSISINRDPSMNSRPRCPFCSSFLSADQAEPVFYSAIFVLADFSGTIVIPVRQCL
jgi:hypothetical protein